MKVTPSRSCKKRIEDMKKTHLNQSSKKNNFLIKHNLQNLKTVKAILDNENIIYKSSVPLSKQILKDVPFVKLIHDNISKKKLYLMRLNTRIDLDDNNILTDPKMIKQIPYVNMQGVETPEVRSQRTRRAVTTNKSPIVHSTPTRSRRYAPIIISSDEDEENGNELSTQNISPIKGRRRKSDLSLKEKSLLSPSIMKASHERSNVKKRVSFAESVSFLDDELEDSDESYSNEKSKSSTSKDKNDKSEVISRKSKRLNQNTDTTSLVDEDAETSTKKTVKSSTSKTVASTRKSSRIIDLNNKPMPASRRRKLMEKIRKEEILPKKLKPMPASKRRQYEEKQKQKDIPLIQENKESVESETEDLMQRNKNSEIKKKVIVKPMPASMKRKLLCKMLKKPMPASKRRLLEEKYNEGDAESKRNLAELPESSSSSLKKLKRKDLLKPMPASQRRKLENRLRKQDQLNEHIQSSSNSDENDDDDFEKNNHESECDSPVPGNMSAEMLHKRDHVSKSKKRYSLDCSALETKNLLSEFSSEDEQSEDENESVIVLNSDDDADDGDADDDDNDDVNVDETKEEVQNTEKEDTKKKLRRKSKSRRSFLNPTANKQIVQMKRKIQVLNNSILKLKKKREIKIRFKKTKEYKCDVCFKAYMEKCSLQLHFLKHVQPLEIEIRLYRYKLPIHFNVTPYNEQKFLKSKREMNRFLNEDINNLVNKYVAHRDNETDDVKTGEISSTVSESIEDSKENAVVLDNVLITAPKELAGDDATENENELPVDMNASVEAVILEPANEGSQLDTVGDEANETETFANENNVIGQKEDATTSELINVEKENQSSTVEASKDHDDNPVIELSEAKPDENKCDEESSNSKSELQKVPSMDNISELNINDNAMVISDSDDACSPIAVSQKEPKVDESSDEKQDKRSDEAIEQDSIDVEENIVNLETRSNSVEIVDISEETSVKYISGEDEMIEDNNCGSDILSESVEISEIISPEDSISEIEKTAEINLSAKEEILSKIDNLEANSSIEQLSKDSDILEVSVEKEVASGDIVEEVESQASATETRIEHKVTDEAKKKESVEDSNESVKDVSDTQEDATNSSGNDDEPTKEKVDGVSEVVESSKSIQENRDYEDKEDDLHLCVESDDTQETLVADDTTKETVTAKKVEDNLVTRKVSKSGDFEKFLKCLDTESLNLPSSSAKEAMSQAELINTLESSKED